MGDRNSNFSWQSSNFGALQARTNELFYITAAQEPLSFILSYPTGTGQEDEDCLKSVLSLHLGSATVAVDNFSISN
ncbi:Hypothetical predicted protein [Paramuricea clavata]|uniref:Uncharacterized protein n=1 Tax=Paramuricea clavata TaxID=317549 RepID=A0A7D9HMV3_PARCT|nr:Hypothetical predicted protein [Paramuricea clavata]